MDILITLVLTILFFGLLVFVHEFGHFIVAIKSGVYVEEFAFGFGPKIVSKKWKGVTYRINMIPLGGYVKMMGDMDGSSFRRYASDSISPKDRQFIQKILSSKGLDKKDSNYSDVREFIKSQESKLTEEEYSKLEKYLVYDFIPNHPNNFDNKSFLVRFSVLVAGVVMNFILGSMLFYILFFFTNFTIDMTRIGEPVFYGANISNPPVIFQVYKDEYKEYEGSLIISFAGEKLLTDKNLEKLLIENYDKETAIEIQNADGVFETEIILTGDGLHTNFDDEVRDKVLILNISEDSAAQKAGLEDGDIILKFAGVQVQNPDQLRALLDEFRGEQVDINYINTRGEESTTVINLPDPEEGEPILGAVPVSNSVYYEDAIRIDYSDNKLLSGVLHSTNLILYNVSAMSEFVREAFREKSVEPVFSKVNSIVAVVDVTFYFVKADNFISILNLVAMLSVILAFMNILPIPLFDGGHLLLLFIEKIRGKKISTSTQNRIGQIVFMLLIILTLLIVFKDILQFDWPRRISDTVLGIIK